MQGFRRAKDVVSPMSVLVIDVGTTNVKAVVVHEDGHREPAVGERLPASHPGVGLSEFDPAELARVVIDVSNAAIAAFPGRVEAVGISTQRASTVLWDSRNGAPVGTGIGWQDLRTVGQCLGLQSSGLRLAPNQSATKLAYLLSSVPPAERHHMRFSTVDSWVVAALTSGEAHVTDVSNAAVSGLLALDASGWDEHVIDVLSIPANALPRLVDSRGEIAPATALIGAPPISALIGDQQSSLIGQGRFHPGEAKVTFGTGGMLDCCLGDERPAFPIRGESGSFPIVVARIDSHLSWGIEAVMLSAGSCIDWLHTGLRLIDSPAESASLGASVRDSGGVYFVPALSGLGAPEWDFGARGTLVGLDASTERAHIVRAVLEGIAHRAMDLLDAAEHDAGREIESLGLDGGMSANPLFVQLLADATGRPIRRAREKDSTTLGAGFLAGVACHMWADLDEAASTLAPPEVIEPARRLDRSRWLDARARSLETVPALSMLKF
jgi:glycerol kinase